MNVSIGGQIKTIIKNCIHYTLLGLDHTYLYLFVKNGFYLPFDACRFF